MHRNTIRLLTLAIVVVLAAAQFHVCMDATGTSGPAHVCQICVSGALAIIPVHTDLSVALVVQPLEESLFTRTPGLERTEFRTTRAPPSA